jgi:hypothetical protein
MHWHFFAASLAPSRSDSPADTIVGGVSVKNFSLLRLIEENESAL